MLAKFLKKNITGCWYYKENAKNFPTEIPLAIHNTLGLPHRNYCILSWGAYSNTISILQKKAVRAIASAGYNAHTEPFFKLYNLLNIEDTQQTFLEDM